MEALQEMLLKENPELSSGDAHDLAWEWAARADEAAHQSPAARIEPASIRVG